MIYLFYGSDQERARVKWHRVITSFQNKYPTGAVFHFTAERFDPAELLALAQGEDLFGAKRLVALDRVLERAEGEDFFLHQLELFSSAALVLVWLETTPESALIERIKTTGGKVEEEKIPIKDIGAPFNAFALTDALAARDRKRLWLVYQRALAAGLVEEELFWKLVWQVKTLLLVQNSPHPPAGLKPFLIDKSRRALKNFKVGELERLSARLVQLWHEARRGQADFAIGLEKLVLAI